ncbi:MAG: cytochrome c biosis protein CcmG, thiol:disulfide interchange protein DsbE [Actinomycetota bacterium]|jgi:cytochrome c biogenesis protein CcmG/thiol:disulfide interchange protein DsbE|nr:cytochrome c biosis protein CcmG, thiol:disulfide interchange protein DsbE [Actinomycetota bacterium]
MTPDSDDDTPPPGDPLVTGIRRTRRGLWIAVGVLVPVFLLVVVFATRPSASTRSVKSPLLDKAAPAVESTTIDGDAVKLSDLRGQWVVVNFFATWCVPCRIEHSELVKFHESHQAAGDAAVIGVVFSDSSQAVKEFRSDEGGTWPMLTDPGGSIALHFGVSGVPESFLVDPDGIVRARILGGVRAVDLDRLLAEARAGG